MLMISHH